MSAIPDLKFPPPYCPECGEECTFDGGWYCEHCCIVWAQDGTLAERPEDDVPPG